MRGSRSWTKPGLRTPLACAKLQVQLVVAAGAWRVTPHPSPMALRFVAGAMEFICGIGSSDVTDLELELAEIAASSVGLRQRADSFLVALRRWVPFDAAWMALADTQHPDYTGVADMDLDDSVREY